MRSSPRKSSRYDIAVLWHETDRDRDLSGYLIHHYTDMWREMGLEVCFTYGTKSFVPADVGILHVDLSVVPQMYLDFAKRYSVCLNGRVADIRKSTISRISLQPDDPYSGPVIVKSDLNNAGNPEQQMSRFRERGGIKWLYRRVLNKVNPHAPLQQATPSALDYEIFDELRAVPREYFADPAYVVEKFLPEKIGDTYYVRIYQFLGTNETATRIASSHPIVCSETMLSSERIDPHPDVVARRHELNFDYGKFDYVVHDGKAILLDTNKTVGGGRLGSTPLRDAARRYRAEGILAYLPGETARKRSS